MGIIHGNYNDTSIVPLLVDSYGRAIVTIAAGSANIGDVDVLTMPVTQVKSSNNNHLISYESFIGQELYNLSLAAGTNVVLSTTPTAGKIFHITNIAIRYIGTVVGVTLYVNILVGGISYMLFLVSPIVSLQVYDKQGDFYIPSGGKIEGVVLNATLGDAFLMYITGNQMDVS
jgi:hypothetical protein